MSAPVARRLSAETRREQILEVAQTLFIECGFEGVAMNDVARALGTSRPTVYTYFTSTGEMLRALLDAHLPLLWERLHLPVPMPGLPVAGPSLAATDQASLYSAVFRALLGERHLLLLLHSGGGPTFRLQRDQFLTRLTERLAPGPPGQTERHSGAPEVVTLLLEAAAVQALRHPGRDTEELARRLGQFIVGGLGALAAES